MLTNKLAKLIAAHPEAELAFISDDPGFHPVGFSDYAEVLEWNDVPYEIACNFTYVTDDVFYSRSALRFELELSKRAKDVDVGKAMDELEQYWKKYILVWTN